MSIRGGSVDFVTAVAVVGRLTVDGARVWVADCKEMVMARRSESVGQREARERLRERHELEVRAVSEFFGIEDRIVLLRTEIARLEDEQAVCVTRLVETTDVSRAAAVICWPVTKTREVAGRARSESPHATIAQPSPSLA